MHSLTGQCMGTRWHVTLAVDSEHLLSQARQTIVSSVKRVEAQMSHWDADSDLSVFNRAPAGSWHVVKPEMFNVLSAAHEWWQRSQGAFDPNVLSLHALWGFGPKARPGAAACLPEEQAVRRIWGDQEQRRLVLDPDTRSVLQTGYTALDLSAIAKGFAVDLVYEALQALGVRACLVEIGGELRVSQQRADGSPWRIAVQSIASGQQTGPALNLSNMAVATSGDQWLGRRRAGKLVSHTLDPRTGRPIQHGLAAVTVVHAQCMHADALSTLLTVLGPEQGLAFAKENQLAALFVVGEGAGLQLSASPAFLALI